MGHACVELHDRGSRVVIDPGSVRHGGVLESADAVLVTHEHFDHFSESRVREALEKNPALQVWTVRRLPKPPGPAGSGELGHRRASASQAAGISARPTSSQHAAVHADVPQVVNAGFLLATAFSTRRLS
jgi:L-ascorbate metabolism protein UlaG (beta-lactamase superfamily)